MLFFAIQLLFYAIITIFVPMANSIVLNLLFKKEYLKEFLIAFCGGNYPIEANVNPIISYILKPLVSSPPAVPPHILVQKELQALRQELAVCLDPDDVLKINRKISKAKNIIDQYKNGCTVMVQLTKYSGVRIDSMNYISPENQHLFEMIIHSLFRELFMLYIDSKLEAGFTKTDAINQFCYRYNIPLNIINFQMLKKKHDRYVKRLSIDKKRNKNVTRMSREVSRNLTGLQLVTKQA